MSSDSKARIKRIIQALQDKTTDNGCSEAEALEAARKMGELLEEHDLSLDDVGLREEAGQSKKNELYAADNYAGSMVAGIAKFCSLVCYQENSKGAAGTFVIFGLEHDLEVAKYLYEVCSEACDWDWSRYMETHGYSVKKRASFRAGFAGRIYERLMEMKAERDARMARMSDRTDLVVLKDQLVRGEFNKLGVRLTKAAPRNIADPNAYRQGQVAGAKVNLSNPLGGPGSSAAIR